MSQTNPYYAGAPEERNFEDSLRPASLGDFIGQRRTVDNLSIAVRAARDRGEPLDHVLFSGLPGVGKTTLARIIASEMGTRLSVTSGPVLKRAADLVGMLTRLKRGDVLFIDEIHRIPADVEEYLYSAMEDFRIALHVEQGPHARTVELPLERFTLAGATTREGLLSEPFRSRFGLPLKLDFYPQEEIEAIVRRTASLLSLSIEPAAVATVASRSRGIPRIANRYVRRVRDLAQVRGAATVTDSIAREALERLGVDRLGLEEIDRKILRAILAASGQPLGLKTISVAVGEQEGTIEEVYEPFLIRENFLIKTQRGRMATRRASEHLEGSTPGPATLF
ncbi:MAG TPA: Holliday junction branch migration DNA helicase RuvB [Planctomycetota bacterium]|nr:Holliday junction branch migration DNA helicase RuvB [Planctomycetota bacterium]